MSKNYKRKHRVISIEEVDKRLDSIANNKKSKKTTETGVLILGILFLLITSPYILTLIVGIYFNSKICSKLADKYINLKIFN